MPLSVLEPVVAGPDERGSFRALGVASSEWEERGMLYIIYQVDKPDSTAIRAAHRTAHLRYLDEHLLRGEPGLAEKLRISEWIHGPGLPDNAALPVSDALREVETQARAWSAGPTDLKKIPSAEWSTQEWLHFLRSLPEQLSPTIRTGAPMRDTLATFL